MRAENQNTIMEEGINDMVELIYYTKDYHKLVEAIKAVCYDTFHKTTPTSHNSVRAVMAKGHLSVSSVGTMVFKIKEEINESILLDTMNMKEINSFVRVSLNYGNKNNNGSNLISMNMLSFLDIYNNRDNYVWTSDLLEELIEAVGNVDELRWFYDKSVKLEESENSYIAKGQPKLYEPIVLEESYTTLKSLGLNDYELDIHATITMNFITDRSASLQFWRHAASVGGCELSQRYVERGNAVYRDMIDVDDEEIKTFLSAHNEFNKEMYQNLLDMCDSKGIRKGRAKEIARSILPNSMTTQLLQSRTYGNWKHLFKLRDDKHAQREIQEDVIHMKRVLKQIGVEF